MQKDIENKEIDNNLFSDDIKIDNKKVSLKPFVILSLFFKEIYGNLVLCSSIYIFSNLFKIKRFLGLL